MYILVKGSAPRGLAINGVGHTALMTYLKSAENQETKDWLEHSFKKVTCILSDEEFEEARLFAGAVICEESAIDDEEIAIGFAPRYDWPEKFLNYKLIS